MIRLNAFIQVDKDKKAEVLAIAKELVEKSLKDEGCVAYDIFVSGTRDDVMMICETWRDDAALAAHSAAPHFTTLVPKMQSLCEMKLERFEF
jgi:quinol monooxygenase YgiN